MASFFLEGGTWQAEDVDEDMLFHAADRVIAAARAATSLQAGREPVLTPGPWCGVVPPVGRPARSPIRTPPNRRR